MPGIVLQKEEPMKLLHLVIGQQTTVSGKDIKWEGYQEDNIAKTLKVHPYRVKLLRHTRMYPWMHVKKMIICRDIDYKFKSSYLDRMLYSNYLYGNIKANKNLHH